VYLISRLKQHAASLLLLQAVVSRLRHLTDALIQDNLRLPVRPFSFPVTVNTRIPHRYTRERKRLGIRLPRKRLIYRRDGMWIRNRHGIQSPKRVSANTQIRVLSLHCRKQYSPNSKVGNAIHRTVTPIDLIGFSRHTLRLHNSPHTLTNGANKGARKNLLSARIVCSQSLSCACASI